MAGAYRFYLNLITNVPKPPELDIRSIFSGGVKKTVGVEVCQSTNLGTSLFTSPHKPRQRKFACGKEWKTQDIAVLLTSIVSSMPDR